MERRTDQIGAKNLERANHRTDRYGAFATIPVTVASEIIVTNYTGEEDGLKQVSLHQLPSVSTISAFNIAYVMEYVSIITHHLHWICGQALHTTICCNLYQTYFSLFGCIYTDNKNYF